MLTVTLQIASGLSWPSLYVFVVAIATTFLILIFMRRYRSRQALMKRVAELEALSGAGRAMVAAELLMARFRGILRKNCWAGTQMMPPPRPNRPAGTPVNNPHRTDKVAERLTREVSRPLAPPRLLPNRKEL